MPFSPSKRLLLAALTLVALLLAPAAASPTDRVVLFGAASGSHLRLTVSGKNVVVEGAMADTPRGCNLVRGRNLAVCPLAGAGEIEIEMGPNNDFVRVLDPLPLPLNVRLGDGEDKFIGNDEIDRCYPEGSRRNRCIGEGGNDVCVTGSQNSDCVGGEGNDYCRHAAGSDGCWGGPGDDVCYMGAGQDGCHGEEGDDRLYGEASPDQLYGGRGEDYCDGGPGMGYSRTCEAGPGD